MFGGTWEWIRIFGFLAYFYFTVAVVFGLLRKSSYVKSFKNLIYHTHIYASWGGFFVLIGHMMLLLIDKYQIYTISELLIPFTAEFSPIISGLGTIAFYLFFIVIFTSDILIKKLKRNIWKGIHFLVLPAWLISLIHGIIIGTDSSNKFVLILYGSTAALVFFIMILRFTVKAQKSKKEAPAKPTKAQTGVSH